MSRTETADQEYAKNYHQKTSSKNMYPAKRRLRLKREVEETGMMNTP